jgi:hypothetical protein
VLLSTEVSEDLTPATEGMKGGWRQKQKIEDRRNKKGTHMKKQE